MAMKDIEKGEATQAVAAKVKAARTRLGWTQALLGERAGMSEGQVARLESLGRRIDVEDVWRLAEAFDIPPGILLAGSGADVLQALKAGGHELPEPGGRAHIELFGSAGQVAGRPGAHSAAATVPSALVRVVTEHLLPKVEETVIKLFGPELMKDIEVLAAAGISVDDLIDEGGDEDGEILADAIRDEDRRTPHAHTFPVDASLTVAEAWAELCLMGVRATDTGSETWATDTCDGVECAGIARDALGR